MNNKLFLFENIARIHTTKLGTERIKSNLAINVDDVVSYCINLIKNKECKVTKKGKNFYCYIKNAIITINASSLTIITAHKN